MEAAIPAGAGSDVGIPKGALLAARDSGAGVPRQQANAGHAGSDCNAAFAKANKGSEAAGGAHAEIRAGLQARAFLERLLSGDGAAECGTSDGANRRSARAKHRDAGWRRTAGGCVDLRHRLSRYGADDWSAAGWARWSGDS